MSRAQTTSFTWQRVGILNFGCDEGRSDREPPSEGVPEVADVVLGAVGEVKGDGGGGTEAVPGVGAGLRLITSRGAAPWEAGLRKCSTQREKKSALIASPSHRQMASG